MYCSQPRVRGRKRSQAEQTRLSTSPCVKALLHFLHSHPYSSPGQEQQQGTKSTQQLQSIASAVPAAALEIYRNQREQGGVFKADTEGKLQPDKEERGRIKLTLLWQHHCCRRWVSSWHKSLWLILLTACRVCLLHNKHLLLPREQKSNNPATCRIVPFRKYCPC